MITFEPQPDQTVLIRFSRSTAPAKDRVVKQQNWPIWARLLKRRRLPGDRGVGDTVEHVHGLMGSERFLVWHWAVFGRVPGKSCQCPAKWNKQYPYEG